jgi:hypothetical protein
MNEPVTRAAVYFDAARRKQRIAERTLRPKPKRIVPRPGYAVGRPLARSKIAQKWDIQAAAGAASREVMRPLMQKLRAQQAANRQAAVARAAVAFVAPRSLGSGDGRHSAEPRRARGDVPDVRRQPLTRHGRPLPGPGLPAWCGSPGSPHHQRGVRVLSAPRTGPSRSTSAGAGQTLTIEAPRILAGSITTGLLRA